ncbi:MAG: hypothetical protein ABW161_17320 [Candidatus Thiodiazotropha sp.]
MMTVRNAIYCLSVLILIGCSGGSDPLSSLGELSMEECEKIGGSIIEGIGCVKDIPVNEMKAMCENNGMKYVEELNGCIE